MGSDGGDRPQPRPAWVGPGLPVPPGAGGGTHWAPDEEHGEGPHDGHVPEEGLQDDPQHPVELGGDGQR